MEGQVAETPVQSQVQGTPDATVTPEVPEGGQITTPAKATPEQPQRRFELTEAQVRAMGIETLEGFEAFKDYIPAIINEKMEAITEQKKREAKEREAALKGTVKGAKVERLLSKLKGNQDPTDFVEALAEELAEVEDLKATIAHLQQNQGLTPAQVAQLSQGITAEEIAKQQFLTAPENKDVFANEDAKEYFFKLIQPPPEGSGRKQITAKQAIKKVRENFKIGQQVQVQDPTTGIWATEYEGTPTSPQPGRQSTDPVVAELKKRREALLKKPAEERKAVDFLKIFSADD